METIEIIYQDPDVLVVNKPAGTPVFKEGNIKEKVFVEYLTEKFPFLLKNSPPRYGAVHRLDKETSGVLLIAKNEEALNFLQKQFKKKSVFKSYTALVVGEVKEDNKEIKTLIGRSKKRGTKQKVYLPNSPHFKDARLAITNYQVIKKYLDYTLLKVIPQTGRKHQIRVHLAHAGYPIAGDKKYCFKKQKCPQNLNRHFLHAEMLKIKLLNNKENTFKAELPEDLKDIIKKIN